MHILLILFVYAQLCYGLTLRCGNHEVEAREDHFELWSKSGSVIYGDTQLALSGDDGNCYYFGNGLRVTWKRLGGLTLPVRTGGKLKMDEVIAYNRVIDSMRRMEEIKIFREQLMADYEHHQSRCESAKNSLLQSNSVW